MTALLDEGRAGYSQLLVRFKLLEQKLEVIFVERNVCIEIAKDIELDALELLETCIESLDLRGKTSVSMRREAHEFYPRVKPSVLFNKVGRAIG